MAKIPPYPCLCSTVLWTFRSFLPGSEGGIALPRLARFSR
jgi:hypothetical protein